MRIIIDIQKERQEFLKIKHKTPYPASATACVCGKDMRHVHIVFSNGHSIVSLLPLPRMGPVLLDTIFLQIAVLISFSN